jgi:hypothetical protein
LCGDRAEREQEEQSEDACPVSHGLGSFQGLHWENISESDESIYGVLFLPGCGLQQRPRVYSEIEDGLDFLDIDEVVLQLRGRGLGKMICG